MKILVKGTNTVFNKIWIKGFMFLTRSVRTTPGCKEAVKPFLESIFNARALVKKTLQSLDIA